MDPKKINEKIHKIDKRNTSVNKTFLFPNGKEESFLIRTNRNFTFTLGITKNSKIILAKQRRPGPEKRLFEMPGWVIDEGEEPLQWAKREFLEETGYTWEFEYVRAYDSSPYSDSKAHLFLAKNCEKISEQSLDTGEIIETWEYSIEETMKLLRKNDFLNVWRIYRCLDHAKLL